MHPDTPMTVAAQLWHKAGCSVIRVKIDGSKAPLGQWAEYQRRQATPAELSAWFSDGHSGLGIVCGAASNNLEVLEFEGRATGLIDPFRQRLETMTSGVDLWERITGGYTQSSPSGGLHLVYRVAGGEVDGNRKLASSPQNEVWIETRGEGGMIIGAPSHGTVHPSGQPWTGHGDPADIALILDVDRDVLHAVAASLDQAPHPIDAFPDSGALAAPLTSVDGAVAPGQDYNLRATWEEILEPADWQITHRIDGRTFWRRPGKRHGWSAVTGGSDGDLMFVWSTSTVLPSDHALSKWRVYALLYHGGDFPAAAAELRRQGYGTDRPISRLHEGTQWTEISMASSIPPAMEPAAPLVRSSLRARLYQADELDRLPQPRPLIDNTLDLGTVALLAGYYGSLKSFVAQDWAACVASDKDQWQGRHVAIHGNVLYVAAEGAHGLHGRFTSWKKGWQQDAIPGLTVLAANPNLRNMIDLEELRGIVVDGHFQFVIIDTLAKCIPGLDENSAKEMGQAVDALYALRESTGDGTVLAVHHAGKDRAVIRGSSALEAGVDTVHLTEGEAEHMMLTRQKRKDGPTFDQLHLRLSPVDYTDSCVLEAITGGVLDLEDPFQQQRKPQMTDTAQRVLKVFQEITVHPGQAVGFTALVKSCHDAGIAHKAPYRGIERLIELGRIRVIGTERTTRLILIDESDTT